MATLVVQPSAKDQYISEYSPDVNFGDAALQIRDWNYPAILRAILEFVISSLPAGATLNSASFEAYYYSYGQADPVGKVLLAYKLSRTDWVEAEATWNIYKTGSGWTAPGGDYVTESPDGASVVVPASYGWLTFDVLDIVQDAYDGGNAVELLLRFADEAVGAYSVVMLREGEYEDGYYHPKLTVVYNEAAPTVTTQAVSDIGGTTATGNGNVTDLGDAAVTQHGHCWSTSANPTTADDKTENGAKGATGAFTSSITDLTKGTLYHCRAYATNAYGTSYGSDVTFTTVEEPTVTTDPATAVGRTTATLNGTLDDDGEEACDVRFQYGETIAYGINTAWQLGKESVVAFAQAITGLSPNTTYHFRAQARNSAGTVNGDDRTFTTNPALAINRAYALAREEL
ncbi:hypothetical protein ES703_89808 [subsurface metagenome]